MDKWTVRVGEMKTRFGIETDCQAARCLGISAQALGQILNGKDAMGVATKLLLLERLGWTSLRDALLEALPECKQDALSEHRTRRKYVRSPLMTEHGR